MEVENNPLMDRTNYLLSVRQPPPPKGDYASLAKKVFAKREENGKRYYLVQWKGYSVSEATWEPSEKLGEIMDMVIDYEIEERWKQEHTKGLISMNEKRHANQELSDDEGPKKFSKGEKGPQQTENNPGLIKLEPSVERPDEINNEQASYYTAKSNDIRALLQHQASGALDLGPIKKAIKSVPIERSFEKERTQPLREDEYPSLFSSSEKGLTPKKRGPGRPRKSEKQDQDENLQKSDEKQKPFTIIRTPIGRGRPRKDTFFAKFAELRRKARAQQPHAIRLSEKGKRLGRPPKPIDEQNIIVKRPLGRPRKNSFERITPKKSGRGRGRPRKDGKPNHKKNEEEVLSSDEEEGSEDIEYSEGSESQTSEESKSEEVSDENIESGEEDKNGKYQEEMIIKEKRKRGRPRKIPECGEEEKEAEELAQEYGDIVIEQPIFSDLEENPEMETPKSQIARRL